MTFETIKWVYQRISTSLIIILSIWLANEAYKIDNYDYETIDIFFKNFKNLFLFSFLIIFSILHTSIEVFHAINDYFGDTKIEKNIKFIIKSLYFLVFTIILIFINNFNY
ncbi:MAG: hypothetical protein CFH19_00036 [Alphaproteobacteria bacterium MarineAlpha5_Bin9]|nr:MAG: hypothetical protein CFH19_00036 [Alphaproteobacteria bacterium MarineAlpha5_Bin9]|tara:strand:+ start:2956 stop:3285 length:330 start_codon:yes stop_codon:yes gene_type:complete